MLILSKLRKYFAIFSEFLEHLPKQVGQRTSHTRYAFRFLQMEDRIPSQNQQEQDSKFDRYLIYENHNSMRIVQFRSAYEIFAQLKKLLANERFKAILFFKQQEIMKIVTFF